MFQLRNLRLVHLLLKLNVFKYSKVDGALKGITGPGQSGPGSDGSEWTFHIPQSSRTGASSSDGLLSYPGHSLRVGVGWSNSLADMQLVYFTAPVGNICGILLES